MNGGPVRSHLSLNNILSINNLNCFTIILVNYIRCMQERVKKYYAKHARTLPVPPRRPLAPARTELRRHLRCTWLQPTKSFRSAEVPARRALRTLWARFAELGAGCGVCKYYAKHAPPEGTKVQRGVSHLWVINYSITIRDEYKSNVKVLCKARPSSASLEWAGPWCGVSHLWVINYSMKIVFLFFIAGNKFLRLIQ